MPVKNRANGIVVSQQPIMGGRAKRAKVYVSLTRRPGFAVVCDCSSPGYCTRCNNRIFSNSGAAELQNGGVSCPSCSQRHPIIAVGPHCQPKKERPKTAPATNGVARASTWKRK